MTILDKSIVVLVMALLLGIYSVTQHPLVLFLLSSYILVLSFMDYRSVHKSNLVHMSWILLCLAFSVAATHFFHLMLAVMILPLSMVVHFSLIGKVKSFVFVRMLDTVLFVAGIASTYTERYELAGYFFVAAILIRHTQFPFHFWIKDTTEAKEYYPSFLLFLLAQSGFLLYSKSYLHNAFSGYVTQVVPVLTLLTGVLTAIGALREKDNLTRHLLLIVSQTCLPLAAFYSHNSASATGGVLFALLIGAGGAVSALLAFHIYLQKGITRLDRYYSLYRSNKNMAAIYFVASLSIVGLPFTLGYIAEDILFHGLIENSPVLAGVYILMTAVNGFTLFQAFNHLFLGHTQYKSSPLFLKRKNKLCISIAMLFVLLGGVFSGPFAREVEQKLLHMEKEYSQLNRSERFGSRNIALRGGADKSHLPKSLPVEKNPI